MHKSWETSRRRLREAQPWAEVGVPVIGQALALSDAGAVPVTGYESVPSIGGGSALAPKPVGGVPETVGDVLVDAWCWVVGKLNGGSR